MPGIKYKEMPGISIEIDCSENQASTLECCIPDYLHTCIHPVDRQLPRFNNHTCRLSETMDTRK